MIRLSDAQGRLLDRVLGAGPMPGDAPDISALRAQIREQLDSPEHFPDLIDSVARVLSDPRFRPNNDYIGLMRRAILSPMELAKFRAMGEQSLSCHNCNATFAPYEMVSAVGRNVFCWRCARPEQVTCGACDEAISLDGLSRTVQRITARHTCAGRRPATPDAADEGASTVTLSAGGASAAALPRDDSQFLWTVNVNNSDTEDPSDGSSF